MHTFRGPLICFYYYYTTLRLHYKGPHQSKGLFFLASSSSHPLGCTFRITNYPSWTVHLPFPMLSHLTKFPPISLDGLSLNTNFLQDFMSLFMTLFLLGVLYRQKTLLYTLPKNVLNFRPLQLLYSSTCTLQRQFNLVLSKINYTAVYNF